MTAETQEKVKVKANTCYSTSYRRSEVLYNLGSGSWSAWANDTLTTEPTSHLLGCVQFYFSFSDIMVQKTGKNE